MKTSIYLPDELGEEVRVHNLPLSAICQEALRAALHDATWRTAATHDIQDVVARLQATVNRNTGRIREGREDGIKWAREFASAEELQDVAQRGGSFVVQLVRAGSLSIGALTDSLHPLHRGAFDQEDHYWRGFAEGAAEVWAQVAPLLNRTPPQPAHSLIPYLS